MNVLFTKKLVLAVISTVVVAVSYSHASEPLKAKKHTRVDTGDHIKSTIVVSTDRVDCWDEIYTKQFIGGFRGARGIALEDGDGNILWTSPKLTVGVDSESEFWGTSKRKKHNHWKVSKATLAKAKRVLIYHYEDGKFLPGWNKETIAKIKAGIEVGKGVKDLIPLK